MVAKRALLGLPALLASLLGACQTAPPEPAPDQTAPPAASAEPASNPPIDWADAADCQARLGLLEQAARAGRLTASQRIPIAVALPGRADDRAWLAPPSVAITADLPLEVHEGTDAAMLGIPCVILVEPARDQRVGHRPISRDTVRSLYQSGVRSEKNPDYDVAQVRVRQAERDLKDDGPDILQVGDPMLDLVGLLVGGVVGGFGQGSHERELDEALNELAATPRSRDRPLYRPYHFERLVVYAGKEATIPVALLDRASGRTWRAELHQRERHEYQIVEGLDPRDRDYERHSQASMTQHDFERWQREPPELALSTIVAALREAAASPSSEILTAARPEPAPTLSNSGGMESVGVGSLPSSAFEAVPDRGWPRDRPRHAAGHDEPLEQDDFLAEPDDQTGPLTEQIADQAWLREDDGLPREPDVVTQFWPRDEAHGPAGLELDADRQRTTSGGELAPAAGPHNGPDQRAASVVHIAAGDRVGSGVYVRHDLVLTTAQLVDRTSVVDLASVGGGSVLGLVARVDPARDLALVQIARAGPSVAFYDGPAIEAGRPVEAIAVADSGVTLTPGHYQGTNAPPAPTYPTFAATAHIDAPAAPEPAAGMPWFLGDRVIGVVASGPGDQPDGSLVIVRSSEILDFLYGAGGALAALP